MNHKNSKQKSRIIVLGANGFIGNAILNRLAETNSVRVPVFREDVDLLHPDASQKLSKILKISDILVVAAAIAPVKNLSMLIQNLQMTESIVSAAKVQNLRYILNISSDAVYEDHEGYLSEQSKRSPNSLHGLMHLTRELCFDTLSIPSGTLCPTLVYGPRDPHNGYGPNQFSRLVKSSQDVELFGEGEELRDHVFIEDVAEISVKMIEKNIRGRINVASGEVNSFKSIATMCLKKANSNVKIKYKERSGPMPHNGYRAFDISKLQSIFPSFKPTLLKNGIQFLFNGNEI